MQKFKQANQISSSPRACLSEQQLVESPMRRPSLQSPAQNSVEIPIVERKDKLLNDSDESLMDEILASV
jgi:hypothetical protein